MSKAIFKSSRVLAFILILVSGVFSYGADRYAVVTGGNWNDPLTWSATSGGAGNAGVPTSSDNVFIENDIDVTLNANGTCASLTMIPKASGSGTTIFTVGGFTLTITGDLVIRGISNTNKLCRMIVSNASASIIVGGNVTIGNGSSAAASAILDLSGGSNMASNLSVAGTFSRNTTDGSFVPGTASTVTFNGTAAGQTIDVTNLTYANVVISNTHSSGATLGAAKTATNITGNVSVTGSGALFKTNNLGFTLAASRSLTINAGATIETDSTQITCASATGTVVISGTFKTKESNGLSGLTTAAINSTNITTLTINSGSTIEYNGNYQLITARTYGGNLTLSGTSGAVSKSFGGAVTVTGNFTSSAGTATSVTFLATGIITFSGNVTIGASTTFTAGAFAHTVAGDWANAGTFTGGTTSTITMSGTSKSITGAGTHNFNNLTLTGASITSNVTTLSIAGNLATSGSGTFTHSTGTLTMSGTTKTISGTGIIFNNLTVSGTVTAAVNFSVAGDLNISNSLITSAGVLTMSGTSKTISGAGTKTFFGLTITGSVTTAVSVGISSALTVSSGTLTASAGTFTFSGTSTVTGTPNLFNVTITATSLTLAASANLGIAGTYLESGGSLNVTSNTPNTVTFNSTGAQNIPAETFNNLTVSGGNTKTATGIHTINNTLTIGSSTVYDAATFSHALAGSVSNAGTFTGSTSTVTMSGTSATISGAGTYNFNDLTITGAGITSSASAIGVSGNLGTSGSGTFAHSSGTLTMSGTSKTITGTGVALNNLTVSGSVSAAVSFSIAGDLSVSNSLTTSSGSVTMSGTSKTISGAGTKTFNGLIITGSVSTAVSIGINSALTVSSGTLTASAGTFTFTGTSTITGSPSLFNVTINGTSLVLATNANLGIAGAYTVSAGSLNATSNTPNTVSFNSSGAQNVPASTYNNLTLTNGNTKTATGVLTVNNTFTIGSSTTFDASSFSHVFAGTVSNSGTYNGSSSSATLSNTGNQNYSGPATISNLTLNTSTGTVTLTANLEVTGTLTITTGKINLSGFTLVCNDISGGSASNYIIATSGAVEQPITSGSSKDYPVGTATAYTPVTIALNSGTSDDFTVNIAESVLANGTSGAAITSDAVDLTWNISEGVAGNSNVTLSVQWPGSLEMSGFTRSACNISHWTGSSWDFGTAQSAGGSDPYTLTRSGITSFSPFGVGEDNGPLPVIWKDINAKTNNTGNIVSWTTASEFNTEKFNIEFSVDGKEFINVGSVPAAGSSSSDITYTFNHNVSAGGAYYRIKQIDQDARFTYSKTVKSDHFGGKAVITPNPVNDVFTVSASNGEVLDVIDLQGRIVKTVIAGEEGSARVDISELPGGIYLLRQGVSVTRFTKTGR